jgi:DME family drug/metabolite transporter
MGQPRFHDDPRPNRFPSRAIPNLVQRSANRSPHRWYSDGITLSDAERGEPVRSPSISSHVAPARSASARSAASATIALVVASLLWGTTGTAASFLGGDVSPIAIGACTMSVGGILLFITSPRPALAAIGNRAAQPWLLLGALGVIAYPLAFYSAMDLAGVAIGNVVALGSGPVFAALFEWLWERQRLSRRGALSTVLAITGVVMLGIFGHVDEGSDRASGGGNVLAGVLLGLLAGFAYALYTYSSTRVIRLGHSGRAAMGATFGLGALGLLPVLLLTGAPILSSATNIGIAAYLAIGPMFVAYVFFGLGLGTLRSSAVTTITLLEPVVATVLAVIVVGERLTLVGWMSTLLILAGVTILASARSAPKPPIVTASRAAPTSEAPAPPGGPRLPE